MGSLAIAVVEKLNFGSHNAAVVDATFTTNEAGGYAIVPGDFGLETLSFIVGEPLLSSAHVYSVSYDRSGGKLDLIYDGAVTTGKTVTVRVLAVGK